MSGFTERIQFIVEAVTGSAEKNLKGLRTQLSEAEGFTGKARAGMSGLASTVKDNLGPALLTGAGALVAFGVNAVQQFTSTAREAGKLADITRLSTEESSRWLSVLSQWGVEGNDLADILNNINAKAAEGALEEFGIQAKSSNERLIESIEYVGQLTDETERARVAGILFGEEGARQLGALTASARTLRDRLAEVSDAQVITDEERQKAADADATMRDFEQTLRDVSLAAGQLLLPVLQNVADTIRDITSAIDDLPSPPDWLTNILTVSLKDIIAPLPGGSGDLARTPYEVIFGLEPGQDYGVKSNATRASAPTTTVNNYLPASTDGRDVDRGLQEYYRRNGPTP